MTEPSPAIGRGGPRAAVLGAGIAGLVAAYRLATHGFRVDVYERWPGLGGQVATVELGGGDPVERYYHHLFTSDRHIVGLYEELDMADAVQWLPSSVSIFAGGRAYPFVTPFDLMRFKPLSPLGRARMAAGAVRVLRHRDCRALEGVTARAWVERSMGAEVWSTVWGPLMRGKFGARADEISMAWLWARITARRRLGGGESRRELLGYPRGSWQGLLERLRAEIERRGGRVLIDRPASRLSSTPDGVAVTTGEPGSWRRGLDPRSFPSASGAERYETVVATVPNDVFLALLDDELRSRVGQDYVDRLERIEYHTALCVLLELDRGFGDYYWTSVADTDIPFVGVVEHTKLVDRSAYAGKHLLYVANYVAPEDPLLALDPDELLDVYEPGLRRISPGFSKGWIRSRMVFREPAAQPIVTVGYGERIPALQTGAPGLLLANTTQIYPQDRGTNYSVELGERAAAAALVQLRAAGAPHRPGVRA